MKNGCIIFLLSIIISLTAYGFAARVQGRESAVYEPSQYLRMHVRADGNGEAAQAVKYEVRDGLVAYLTPIVAECEARDEALRAVRERLSEIESVANGVLRANGMPYGATAKIEVEYFPTRVYDGYTLPAGEYAALIVRLGRGEGENWWCVVYPPLCFTSPTGGNVVYKSKIAEIIRHWRANG